MRRLPQVHDLYPGRAFVVCLALIQSAVGDVPPTIGGVITASTFGGSLSAAPGSFIEIYGADLANTTRQWSIADFDGPRAPTSRSEEHTSELQSLKHPVYHL